MFVCPAENRPLNGQATVFRPVGGTHLHQPSTALAGLAWPELALVCGHCGACQLCGETVGARAPHPVVAELERARQEQQLAGAIALGSLITDLILYRPPKRERWWQFWRAA